LFVVIAQHALLFLLLINTHANISYPHLSASLRAAQEIFEMPHCQQTTNNGSKKEQKTMQASKVKKPTRCPVQPII
jgi:hypothetical protein